MVSGEVKGDSIPERGNFYSLSSGTSVGKSSQRSWCQVCVQTSLRAKTCMSQTKVMAGTTVVLKDSY